jgi:hypothetical protein
MRVLSVQIQIQIDEMNKKKDFLLNIALYINYHPFLLFLSV